VQQSWSHTTLGCRPVAVGITPPAGNVDSVTAASATSVAVAGWAFDPDAPTVSGAVHVYVDGGFAGAVTADGSRPDVAGVFPQAGAAHGFSWSATVAPGNHTVCLYAIDVQQSWSHTTLGCRTVGWHGG
jgi:hypothetical protein